MAAIGGGAGVGSEVTNGGIKNLGGFGVGQCNRRNTPPPPLDLIRGSRSESKLNRSATAFGTKRPTQIKNGASRDAV